MQFAPVTLRGDAAAASRGLYFTATRTDALDNSTVILGALMNKHWDELGIRQARVIAGPAGSDTFKVIAKAASGADFELTGKILPGRGGVDDPPFNVTFDAKSIGAALINADAYKKASSSMADVMPLAAAVVRGTKIGNNGDHTISLYKMPAGTTLQRLEKAISTSGRPNIVIKADDGTYYVMESRVLSRGLFGLSNKPVVGDAIDIPTIDGKPGIKGKIEALANLNLRFMSGVQTAGFFTAGMGALMALVFGLGAVVMPFATLFTMGAISGGPEVGIGTAALAMLAGGVATGVTAGRFMNTSKNELPDMALEIQTLQPF